MAGRKTVEERIAKKKTKIAKKREEIAALETQKHKLQNPVTMKSVMDKAKKAGLTPEEIAKKLGIEV